MVLSLEKCVLFKLYYKNNKKYGIYISFVSNSKSNSIYFIENSNKPSIEKK